MSQLFHLGPPASLQPHPWHVCGLLARSPRSPASSSWKPAWVTFAAASIMSGFPGSAQRPRLLPHLVAVAAIFMLYKNSVDGRTPRLPQLHSRFPGGPPWAQCFAPPPTGSASLLPGARCKAPVAPPSPRAPADEPSPESARGLKAPLVFVGTLLGAVALSPLAAAARSTWRAGAPCSGRCSLPGALVARRRPRLSHETTPPEARSEEHWGWLLGLAVALPALHTHRRRPSSPCSMLPATRGRRRIGGRAHRLRCPASGSGNAPGSTIAAV